MQVYQTTSARLSRLKQFPSPFKMTKAHGAEKQLVKSHLPAQLVQEVSVLLFVQLPHCRLISANSLQEVWGKPKLLSHAAFRHPVPDQVLGLRTICFQHFPQENGESRIRLN